jgi:hypothetical protein
MEKEPVYRNLGTDFGLRRKVVLENGLIIKIYDDDPYYYARVVDSETNIYKETKIFDPDDTDKVISDLTNEFSKS